jgi:tRNA-dihydrouridine synthase B
VRCVDEGAAIVDINMGCPAKKVCKRAAGSALMGDLDLAAEIVRSVVTAVDVPVTLKMRTGWRDGERTAVALARIAEASGVAAVTVHGRSGEQRFTGEAEYATIAEVKASVGIPVIANGDIDSPDKARTVLDATGADGVMIGRGVLGAPWIVGEIDRHLRGGGTRAAFAMSRRGEVVMSHVRALHRFYGERTGVRFARKHVGWYLAHDGDEAKAAARGFNHLPTAAEQLDFIAGYFSGDPRTLAA